jgi:enoyl-CoA hydratase/carnithine racemase
MLEEVLVTREGGIATITLNNPAKLNAINASMWRRLRVVMEELSADAHLRCVVLRGAGEAAFAAGGDIEEFLTLRDTLERALVYHEEWVAGALDAVRDCPHPTVALIQGACIGGGLEIAAQCDLRICGRSARFGVPINRLGFSMAPRELAGLLALAGPAVALELVLEGRILGADEAYEKGLVSRVVDDELVVEEAYAAARRIAAGAPLAARMHKKLVRRLTAVPRELTLEEIKASFAFLDSEDYREGLSAFFEKRAPLFRGK